MKPEITELVNRIETEIGKTPTGDLMNLLCDANITIQTLDNPVIGDLKEFSITHDAGQRVEWINKRVTLSEVQKQYIEFQIKEAIINVIQIIDSNKK